MNSPKSTQSMLALGYPGLLLGAAVLLSTSLLALGHIGSRDAIADRQAEDLQRSLAQVLPPQKSSGDLLDEPLVIADNDGNPLQIYRQTSAQRVLAAAFNVTARDGYGGPIRLLLGVDADGALLGVRVLSHSETPGLGDKIETARSDWILSFNGRSLDNLPADGWAVRKDGGQFDQFTGATITPRAVVNAVHRGLQFFNSQRTQILASVGASSAEAMRGSKAATTADESSAVAEAEVTAATSPGSGPSAGMNAAEPQPAGGGSPSGPPTNAGDSL